MLPSRRTIIRAADIDQKSKVVPAFNDPKSREKESPIITKTFGGDDGKTMIQLMGDKIIIKGNSGDGPQIFEISMKSIKDTLRRLRSHHSVLIKDLHGELAKDYETIKNYVNLMHQSNAEQMINEPIMEIFGDLKKGVLPGTVGAYMNGCNLSTNHKGNPSCAAVCVGSKQPDSSVPGHSPCGYLTLLHTPKGFIALNSPSSKKDAQLVVKEGEPTSFSKEQIDELRSFGIERVKVIAYSDDGVTYRDVTPEFVNVSYVQRQSVDDSPKNIQNINDGRAYTRAPSNGQQTSSASGFWVLVIIAIIIIIVLVVLNNKKGGSSGPAFDSRMFDINFSPY